MRRMILAGMVVSGWVAVALAEQSPWKDYENKHVGIQLRVKKSWTEIFIKDGKTTGSVTFKVSSQPMATVTAQRQSDQGMSYDLWISSDVLHQVFEPGYRVSKTEFAGRKSVKVTGTAKDLRRQETYFSSRPPFVDQIDLAAPAADWDSFREDFTALRSSLRWMKDRP